MSVDGTSAAIGAFGGVAIALITTFGPVAVEKMRARIKEKRLTFSNVLPEMHKVYHHLNEVLVRIGAKRCMVMYTENGGGRPTIGGQLYVSIVYEVYNFKGGSIRHMFQRVRVDESYVQMLGHMMGNEEKRTIVKTEMMPNCMLRSLYENSGTKMSILYLAKETATRLYYTSFNFPHDDLTADLLYNCDLKANQIALLFKDIE